MKWNVKNVWHVWNVANVPYVSNVPESSLRLPRLPNLNFGRRSQQTFLLDLGRNTHMRSYAFPNNWYLKAISRVS